LNKARTAGALSSYFVRLVQMQMPLVSKTAS